MPNIDFFLDLSRWPAKWPAAMPLLARLVEREALGGLGGTGTIVLPSSAEPGEGLDLPTGWSLEAAPDALLAAAQALEQAGLERRSLLVIAEPMHVSGEVVGGLAAALEEDPLFGAAVPRQGTADHRVRRLAGGPEALGPPSLPRRILSDIPRTYIVPELVAPCFLLRRELATNLPKLDTSFRTVSGAWLHYLCRARRLGFRCVVVNDAVAGPSLEGLAEQEEALREDYWALHSQYPCAGLARRELLDHPAHRHESLLGRAHHRPRSGRPELLIDARGLQQRFNGTTRCILGILAGLNEIDSPWRPKVLVQAAPARYHGLARRLKRLEIVDDPGTTGFGAAVRLSQPWDMRTMIELHRLALLNFYLMLDTISWDVLYVSSRTPTLRGTWQFLADHADGLLYDSQFTRDRFRQRFEVAPGVREAVCWLSLHPDEYEGKGGDGHEAPEAHLFVVGNNLDHKFVPETLDLLSSAFPGRRVVALGAEERQSGNVHVLPSGGLAEEELSRIYRNAVVVVFPSFYEGFGFPLLEGLSAGKPVVIRRSSLVTEVAARYAGPGELYTYDRPGELIEIVGALLHGRAIQSLQLGAALGHGKQPLRWSGVSSEIVRLVEATMAAEGEGRWLAREKKIEQAMALLAQS